MVWLYNCNGCCDFQFIPIRVANAGHSHDLFGGFYAGSFSLLQGPQIPLPTIQLKNISRCSTSLFIPHFQTASSVQHLRFILAHRCTYHNISYPTCANGTQLYISSSSHDCCVLLSWSTCIHQINGPDGPEFSPAQFRKDKCVFLSTSLPVTMKHERSTISVYLNSMLLKATNQASNLGIIIDSDLNFSNHLKSVTKFGY